MFSENLHGRQKFYTTAGRTGHVKCQLCGTVNKYCMFSAMSFVVFCLYILATLVALHLTPVSH